MSRIGLRPTHRRVVGRVEGAFGPAAAAVAERTTSDKIKNARFISFTRLPFLFWSVWRPRGTLVRANPCGSSGG